MNVIRKLRKSDLLLIVGILAVAGLLMIFVNMSKNPGGEISVAVDGEEVLILPLSEDTIIELSSEQGMEEDHINVLYIKDGKAYINEANCPDRVCVNRGEIGYEGETIVCMPHKLVVTVKGGETTGIDGVSN